MPSSWRGRLEIRLVLLEEATLIFISYFRFVTGFTHWCPLIPQSCCATRESTCSLTWWLPPQARMLGWSFLPSFPRRNANTSRVFFHSWLTCVSRWAVPVSPQVPPQKHRGQLWLQSRCGGSTSSQTLCVTDSIPAALKTIPVSDLLLPPLVLFLVFLFSLSQQTRIKNFTLR